MSEKKRLNALAEIFESEKSYLDDLKQWHIDFNNKIMGINFITGRKKSDICDTIFGNTYQIYDLHHKIFKKLQSHNADVLSYGTNQMISLEAQEEFLIPKDGSINTTKMEYASTFIYFASKAYDIYSEYVKQLPKSEYEFNKYFTTNLEFKTQITNYLKETGFDRLGVKNFFYRPSGKIARYPMLLKAVMKNEQDEHFKALYEEAIEKIKEMVSKCDKDYKYMSCLFSQYIYSDLLVYDENVANKVYLGLIFKDRILLKDSKLVVKCSKNDPASYKHVFIYNKFILITKVFDHLYDKILIESDPIFFQKIKLSLKDSSGEFAKDENLENFFPIFLIDKEVSGRISAFYFKNKDLQDLFIKLLRRCQEKEKVENPGLGISQLEFKIEDKILSSCCGSEVMKDVDIDLDFAEPESSASLPEFKELSSSGKSIFMANFAKKANLETKFDEISEETSSMTTTEDNWYKNLFKEKDIYEKDMVFKRSLQRVSKNDSLILFCTDYGTYKIVDKVILKVSDFSGKKILYNPNAELLFIQVKNALYVSNFNHTSSELILHQVKITTEDFFLQTSGPEFYLAVTNKGRYGFTFIHLLLVEDTDDEIKITLSKKMYVGFNVSSIEFFKNVVIVATKDFEIIKIGDLRTQDLLETGNPYSPLAHCNRHDFYAVKILKVSKETFLLCYNTVGFFIDLSGDFKITHLSFTWNTEPNDFKIYKKWVVTLSKYCISCFSLETGKLEYFKSIQNSCFVSNTKECIFYSSNNFYRLADDNDELSIKTEKLTNEKVEKSVNLTDELLQNTLKSLSLSSNLKSSKVNKKICKNDFLRNSRAQNFLLKRKNSPTHDSDDFYMKSFSKKSFRKTEKISFENTEKSTDFDSINEIIEEYEKMSFNKEESILNALSNEKNIKLEEKDLKLEEIKSTTNDEIRRVVRKILRIKLTKRKKK